MVENLIDDCFELLGMEGIKLRVLDIMKRNGWYLDFLLVSYDHYSQFCKRNKCWTSN